MSVERIESLHQEASEHYLQGRFDRAIEAWKGVLAIDPADEQALEGVRMSSLLAEGGDAEAAPAAAAPPEVDPLDAEIDAGLKVFEFAGAEGPVGDLPDPSRQSDGIDFGDPGKVAAIPLAEAPATGATSDRSAPAGAGEEVGLAPVIVHVPGVDPAVAELTRRVRALIEEAKARAAKGDTGGALSVLARVQVLDEDNAEAAALEAELRDSAAQSSGEVDRWMIEGVQALEGGHLDEARGWFVKVLHRIPDHAEAEHYLKRIGTVSRPEAPDGAAAPEDSGDLLSSFLSNSEPPPAAEAFPAIPKPVPPIEAAIPSAGTPRRRGPSPSFTPDRVPSPSRRAAILGLTALAVLAGAGGVWYFLGGDGEPAAAEVRPATVPRATAAVPKAPAPAVAPVPPLSSSLARGREAMARGAYDDAVVAYNEALQADPTNAEAQRGMAEATAAYKAVKAHQEQIEGIRSAFEGGEYASALRVIYRLPETFDGATVERWKGNGWFNLGVVALRAGEVPQAIQHFDEALAVRSDADAERWKAFARRYESATKDRAYYATTDSIRFRRLDD